MMERLREGVNSIAVKIILGLIILSFVFAGIGSYLVNGSSNAAAKVTVFVMLPVTKKTSV